MARAVDEKLAKYRSKRDFNKTPEPDHKAEVGAERQLIVQHHYATREHFDLRLEIDGVLVSWAVTRGPSANPQDKRLAVRTEDHPLSYGSFEGVIPKGEYGGGTVILWEQATYSPLNGPPVNALAKGEIKFESHGTRLKGRWVLVRMRAEEKQENWLLIKEKDSFVEPDDSLAQRFPTGVISGLTRDEIGSGTVAPRNTAKAPAPPIPAFVEPMLCDSADKVPPGTGWAFELKYDGYRLELAVADGQCRIYTRTGLDWTGRFRTLAAGASQLKAKSCLIDGEAVVLNDKGLSDFAALLNALEREKATAVSFIAFDILMLDGKDLRSLPYTKRKDILRSLVPASSAIRFGDYFTSQGAEFFKQATEAGAEGIIAKRADAPYRSGRSSEWIKIKGDTREDALVVGFMPSDTGESFASLLAARKNGDRLTYLGRVGTGFDAQKRAVLAPLLANTAKHKPDFTNADKVPKGAVFIAKPFSAEVRYRGWTGDQQMRQASFISLQADRPLPQSTEDNLMPARTGNWTISSSERVVFPEANVTKGDVAAYYEAAWSRLHRHLANRPVSLLRVPEQIGKETFFQRHPFAGMTKGISPVGKEAEPYFALEGEQGLATAVQFGTIELHGWNAVLPDLEHPDRVVFDLDPDEHLSFKDVTKAALLLRDYLEAAGLKTFPMLSGGKGVHILVPLAGKNADEDVTLFAKQMAVGIAAEKPDIFVATMSKDKRKGRIFIDWLRNRTKSTAILPWSLRARPEATVAVPVTWEKLPGFPSAGAFTILTAVDQPDWEGFWTTKQSLPASVLDFLREKQH